MNRRTYDGWGYSPLDQINAGNVARLRPAWVVATGAINGHEAAPVVHDGVMFAATPGNQVMAIDVRTGTVLWRYRRPLAPVGHRAAPHHAGRRALRRQGLPGGQRRGPRGDRRAHAAARCGRARWPRTGAATT